jgi:hypothetical protein
VGLTGPAPRDVFVAGRAVVRDRTLLSADEDDVAARLNTLLTARSALADGERT